MSGLDYETVARFAQQGGTIYFGLIFLAGVVWALLPGRREAYRHLSRLPLENDEAEDV
ncbi:MAG: cbb3-type cytochrome c oxidase subunit 3 [Brevundimonas sp.]|jgi:cytochrome c oxidase cbb3-type subunit 4|uniref:cbb3-type cytochrome c oxidase subunit 3 n=1 Tax=Brevundimonas sp. TaxID=1871086 RepID=UPI0017B85832|nr:cbb3-type cytochrome c oxidase subunit 3 [Brevundimonas sp.]MBA4805710.1 cbb3-type cytochrome c oxidase subunit 3 [Brevundimonas sp.]